MKKLLSALLVIGASVGIANAAQPQASQPMPMMKMDPVCKTAFEHMRTNRHEVESAIKSNDANKVGNLVIANYKYMQDFMAKNPQCKPKHRPIGAGGMMPNEEPMAPPPSAK